MAVAIGDTKRTLLPTVINLVFQALWILYNPGLQARYVEDAPRRKQTACCQFGGQKYDLNSIGLG